MQAHTKIKMQKFLLKAFQPFIRKFALRKISRYMVLTGNTLTLTTGSLLPCELQGMCELTLRSLLFAGINFNELEKIAQF